MMYRVSYRRLVCLTTMSWSCVPQDVLIAIATVIFNIIRSNDPTGKTLLAHELSRFNWASLYTMDHCNAMINLFYHTVISLLDRYLPVRVSSRHATEKPWVNDKFRNLIRQSQKAWKEQDMAKYRALRNLVQRTSNKLRSKYYTVSQKK